MYRIWTGIMVLILGLVTVLVLSACRDKEDDDEDDPNDEPKIHEVDNKSFETGDLEGWTVVFGNAFQDAGITDLETDIYYDVPYGQDGTYFYGRHDEAATGMLRSSTFELGGTGWISFKIGGGKNTALTYLSIREEETQAEIARYGHTEFNSSIEGDMAHYREANLTTYLADLSDHVGKELYIEIVDQSSREWGFMTFDGFETFHETIPECETCFIAEDIKPVFDLESATHTFSNAGFEEGDLSNWTVAYGTSAFQDGHVVDGPYGKRLNNRANETDLGVLRSPAFVIGGTHFISFRLGAAHDNNRDHIYLSIRHAVTNEEIIRTYNSRGRFEDEEATHLYFVDLEEYAGEPVYLELVDNASADWGLIILEDLVTHYPERPFVRDEIALDLLDLGKTERSYAVMREEVERIIGNFDYEDFYDENTTEDVRAFFDDHFETIFRNTFFGTIDGFDVNSPHAGNLSFPPVNTYLEDHTTFTITGDIPAMWLRDSPAQILPYLHFINEDEDVKEMTAGLIRRLFTYIRLDPYANAFNQDGSVWERKFEVDSLSYPIWLSYHYYRLTGDASIFDRYFMMTVDTIIDTFVAEQNHSDENYDIAEVSQADKDKYPNDFAPGIGLIWNGYRPSDDVTKYKYLIPSNMFAVVILEYIETIYLELGLDQDTARRASELAQEVRDAISEYATYEHPEYGTIYAYEVDGLGNYNLMDDANVPSLLSAPWLGYLEEDDPIYLNTRAFILSEENPFYFEGSEAKGIGSEHTPSPYVWPMSLAMQMMTTADEDEIREALHMLVMNTAGTFVMHEGFDVNNPYNYSREWFTWPCALFAEAVLLNYVYDE